MNASLAKFSSKTKIDISEYTDGETHSVTFREPTTAEMKQVFRLQKCAIKFQNSNEDADMDAFSDALVDFGSVLPGMIIAHDFFEDGNPDKKLSSKDVAEFISSKFNLMNYVVLELIRNLPLQKRSKDK